MNYLAVELALYERLVGAPLDAHGKPVVDAKGVPVNRLIPGPPGAPEERARLPSYGVRIPEISVGKNVHGGKHGFNPVNLRDVSRVSFRKVPVYPVNTRGEEIKDVWPCVTYHWYEESFDVASFVYDGYYKEAAPTAPTTQVTTRDSEVIEVPSRYRFKPRSEPYNLQYIIRAYSKNPTEIRLICESIKDLFPARTGIEVTRADGTKTAFDMILNDVLNLDVGGHHEVSANLTGDERYYCKGFVYTIESYTDNSDDTRFVWEERTIRQRILELADAQGRLLETVAAEELDPNNDAP